MVGWRKRSGNTFENGAVRVARVRRWASFLMLTVLSLAPAVRAELPHLVVDSVMNLGPGILHGINELSYAKTVRVLNASSEPGNYFLTFSVPGGGVATRRLARGGHDLAYQIYPTPTSSIPLKDFPDVHVGEILMGRFGSGDVQHVLEFSIRTTNDVWLPPGVYSDSLVIRLFAGTIDNAIEVESQLVQLQKEIAVSTDLALVNNGGVFVSGRSIATLDFGQIESDVERSIECVIRSNVGYEISFYSDNGGHLAHKNGFQIPYTLRMDGAPLTLVLGGESMVNAAFSETPDVGRSHGLSVSLRPDSDQAAGDYADNIRISIWAQ